MNLDEFLAEWNSPSDMMMVHTSGSTGKPKNIYVEKRKMLSSATITCDFLGLKEGDTALLCMSLDYIAGKMMVVRSIERNLNLISVTPSNHPLSMVNMHINFAAMVPSQVYCSLQVPLEKEKLKEIDNLIIGGGAISSEMEDELRYFPNNVWSTYGMTETLSHIALRKVPEQWYVPFSGVFLSVDSDDCLIIDAPHVSDTVVRTNDIVELREGGHAFRMIGRRDNVICSGGIKLHIEEMEDKLRPYINQPYCISKRKDAKFGEIAVLLLEKYEKEIDFSALSPYSIPKVVKVVGKIPLTETGKINRCQALLLADG